MAAEFQTPKSQAGRFYKNLRYVWICGTYWYRLGSWLSPLLPFWLLLRLGLLLAVLVPFLLLAFLLAILFSFSVLSA